MPRPRDGEEHVESAHPTAGLPQTRLSRCSGGSILFPQEESECLLPKGPGIPQSIGLGGGGREAKTREHVPCALFHPGEGDLRAWDSARVQECLPPV